MTNDRPTDRRDFLKMAGVTSVAGLLARPSAVSAAMRQTPNEKRYKKAVKIGMVQPDGSLVDKFRLLKRLGFDGVELNSPNNLSTDDVRRARTKPISQSMAWSIRHTGRRRSRTPTPRFASKVRRISRQRSRMRKIMVRRAFWWCQPWSIRT